MSAHPWSCSIGGHNPEASLLMPQTHQLLPPAGGQVLKMTFDLYGINSTRRNLPSQELHILIGPKNSLAKHSQSVCCLYINMCSKWMGISQENKKLKMLIVIRSQTVWTFSGATSRSSAMGEVEAMVFRSTPWIWKARDMLLTRW